MEKTLLESSPDSQALGLFIFIISLAEGRETQGHGKGSGVWGRACSQVMQCKKNRVSKTHSRLERGLAQLCQETRATTALPQFPQALTSGRVDFAPISSPSDLREALCLFLLSQPTALAAWVFLSSTA